MKLVKVYCSLRDPCEENIDEFLEYLAEIPDSS
jgi:hypothetical protein